MPRTIKAIRTIIRQALRDEFREARQVEFADDELDLHIHDCLIEVSQRRPYEVREEITSDGSKEIDISSISDLLEVEKAEYPVDSDPPEYRDVSVFGNKLRLLMTEPPQAGEKVYLYCHKVHRLTETVSTLSPDLEKVLIHGAVVKAALAWLNKMRAQIVPDSVRLYQGWVDRERLIYTRDLNQLARLKGWKFYD